MENTTFSGQTRLGSMERMPGGQYGWSRVATEEGLRVRRIEDAVFAFGGDAFDAWDAVEQVSL